MSLKVFLKDSWHSFHLHLAELPSGVKVGIRCPLRGLKMADGTTRVKVLNSQFTQTA